MWRFNGHNCVKVRQQCTLRILNTEQIQHRQWEHLLLRKLKMRNPPPSPTWWIRWPASPHQRRSRRNDQTFLTHQILGLPKQNKLLPEMLPQVCMRIYWLIKNLWCSSTASTVVPTRAPSARDEIKNNTHSCFNFQPVPFLASIWRSPCCWFG